MTTLPFPVTRIAFERTVRLVSSARLRDPVLLKLVDQASLTDLAEIESATSGRLLTQHRTMPGLLASGFPHANFVNAAFAYFRPRDLNRFNGTDQGAWYAALSVETCQAEVEYHLTRELTRVGEYNATVEYAEMFASFAGEFVDLRGVVPKPECLDPDTAIGYPAGNALAAITRAAHHNGIVYPSVRHTSGTCLVALWPSAVQSVAQGQVLRAVWSGAPKPNWTAA